VFSSLAKEKDTSAPMETIGELEEVTGYGRDIPDTASAGSRLQLPMSGSYGARPSLASRRSTVRQQSIVSKAGGESPIARSFADPSFTGQSEDV